MAFGCGAGVYFALLREPQIWTGFAGLALAAVLLLAVNRWSRSRVLTASVVLAACFLAGLAMATLRTEGAKAPVAPAEARHSASKAG